MAWRSRICQTRRSAGYILPRRAFGSITLKSESHENTGKRERGLIIAVFLSSWLLFSLEPMSSRLVLPTLGGSPAVWITCLLFFQGALLAGYCYAHLSIRLLGLRRQAILHIVLIAVSFFFLPVSLDTRLDPTTDTVPAVWLLLTLTVSIGIPFLVLSSLAPIAQRWLADGERSNGKDPYYLYAASNLGSLIALLAYPFVVEPLLGLSSQTTAWSMLYAVVLVAVALMAWRVSRRKFEDTGIDDAEIGNRSPRLSDRIRWLLYAAVPSSALMGATSFLSLDLGSFPLLWVLPLAVYLGTFILVFARRPPLPHEWMVKAEPQFIVLAAITIFWAITLPAALLVLMHLALLFFIAMVCHGDLARSRPDVRHLTEFYLWIAVGGLCGGVFNALIAPVVFNDVLEYPLIIVAAALLRPKAKREGNLMDVVAPIIFGILLTAATWRQGVIPQLVPTVTMFALGIILFSFRNRPRRFAFALAITFAVGLVRVNATPSGRMLIDTQRSFFGVYRVIDNPARTLRILEHGSTIHGAQSLQPGRRLEPLTYYNRSGPAADIFSSTRAGALASRRVAVVGLGAGSLSCYGRIGEEWTFYEIDPLVGRLATDTAHFTLLRDCPPETRLIFGDARLTGARAHEASFDMLVIDAFNSGAIPVHLLTREAFQQYLKIVDTAGVIALHVTNEHLDLEPLIAALAENMGLAALVRRDFAGAASDNTIIEYSPSAWIALARNAADLGDLSSRPSWRELRSPDGMRPWTDDFSNIMSVIRWTR